MFGDLNQRMTSVFDGEIIQCRVSVTRAPVSVAVAVPYPGTTPPTTSSGAELTGLRMTFTPRRSGSSIGIKLMLGYLSIASTTMPIRVMVFANGTLAALTTIVPGTSGQVFAVGVIDRADGVPIDFMVRVGLSTSATVGINKNVDGAADPPAVAAILEIQEIARGGGVTLDGKAVKKKSAGGSRVR